MINPLKKKCLKFMYSLTSKEKKTIKIPSVFKYKDNYWAIGLEGDFKYFVPEFATVLNLYNDFLLEQNVCCGWFGFPETHPGIRKIDKTLKEYFLDE